MKDNVVQISNPLGVGYPTVYEMAKKVNPAVVFTDQAGQRRAFRVYRMNNQEGVCDVKGQQVILPARFPHVEISSSYECFVAGDNDDSYTGLGGHILSMLFSHERKGWEAFDLNGKSLLNGQRFETREELYKSLAELTKDWYREGPINMDWLYRSVKLYEKPPFFQRIKQYFHSVVKDLRRRFKNIFYADRVYY